MISSRPCGTKRTALAGAGFVDMHSSVIIERFNRASGFSDTQGDGLAYNDLRDWIAALERAGELKRIKTEVDPILEIAEITDRVSKGFAGEGARATRGGPALFFENPKVHTGPWLTNQF